MLYVIIILTLPLFPLLIFPFGLRFSLSVEPQGKTVVVLRLYSLKIFSLVRDSIPLPDKKETDKIKKIKPKTKKTLLKLVESIRPTLFLTFVDSLDPFQVAMINGLGNVLKNVFGKVIVKTYSSQRPTFIVNCLINFSFLQILAVITRHTNRKENI